MQLVLKQRRYVTLIEMMIVMTLIILIIGVIGYNYRGALDEGKAFKTKTGMEKVETILSLAVADKPSLIEDISNSWEQIVRDSPMVRNPDDLIYDGWGYKYRVDVESGVITIHSDKYDEYVKTKHTQFGK
jgi:type II secretory pathway pseudopilin PulG